MGELLCEVQGPLQRSLLFAFPGLTSFEKELTHQAQCGHCPVVSLIILWDLQDVELLGPEVLFLFLQ